VLAASPAAEAVVAGAASSAVTAARDLAQVRAVFESFSGAVFIKGSRRYHLESLLVPVGDVTGPAH